MVCLNGEKMKGQNIQFFLKSYLVITTNEAKINVKKTLWKYILCSENRGSKKHSWCAYPEWIP